jgi:hypothetical protein
MKKLIALFLVAVMCLPLVACGNTNETISKLEQEIQQLNEKIQKLETKEEPPITTPSDDNNAKSYLGKWIIVNKPGHLLEILENNVSNLHQGGEILEGRWVYNDQLDGILLCWDGNEPYFMQIHEEEGCRYLEWNYRMYHEENLEKAISIESKYNRNLIYSWYEEDCTKAELNHSYDYQEGLQIRITGFEWDGQNLTVNATFTNTTANAINAEFNYTAFDCRYLYDKVQIGSGDGNDDWEIKDPNISLDRWGDISIPAGASFEASNTRTIESDGKEIDCLLMGISFNSQYYYFDLTEYFKK